MSELLERIRRSTWYETAYKISVGVKGFDGLVELLAGLWLLIAPATLHALLQGIFGELVQHHSRFMQFMAENVAHIDQDLAKGGLLIVILFLITHGVVKLALVYCLLKEIIWAYPYALVVLGMFFIYQVYVFIMHPSVSMFLFSLLDAIIIWLVYGEWQKLKEEKIVR